MGPPERGSRPGREQGIEVVSSDEIRKEISSDGETPGSQAGIFHKVRAASSKVLEDGRDVIVDAMHILPEHRLRQIAIAPPDIRIKYVVIDRPGCRKSNPDILVV